MPSDPNPTAGKLEAVGGTSGFDNDATPSDAKKGYKYAADDIWGMFVELQAEYQTRNDKFGWYERFFDGDHWDKPVSEEDDTSFQLVFNFTRAVVMKFTAILSKLPRLRIPMGTATTQASINARNRERYLRMLFDDMAIPWQDVEMNASKKGMGVLQVLWEPEEGQPATITVGVGADVTTKKAFTESPYLFRSVPPERFYPVYRTYDKPDNYLYVIRFDPERLIEDIEEQYAVELQATNQSEGTDGTTDLIELWSKDEYYLIAYTMYKRLGKGQRAEETRGHAVMLTQKKHKYKRPPFFLLQNIRNPDKDPANEGSLGDVDMVADLNKHYNLIMSEAAEEIVTNIHRPLAYKSDDHQQDPQALEMKPGAVYPIGLEEELLPIAWQPMPEAVQQHITSVLSGLKDLSFLGNSGFGEYPQGATGVGLRIVLQSLEQIISLKLPLRHQVLRDVIKFLLQNTAERLKGADGDTALTLWVKDKLGRYGQISLTPETIGRDYFVDVDYGTLLPSNGVEDDQNEIYKFKTGAQSLWTTLDNLGVEDPDAEMERMKAEFNDAVLNPEKVMAQLELKMRAQEMAAPQGGPAGPVPPGGPGPGGQPPGAGGQPPGGQQMPGSAQPGTRPVQDGPSMNAAPPVPAGPQIPGQNVPSMSRSPGQNPMQGQPGPGIYKGGK